MAVDSYWEREFRQRIDQFAAVKKPDEMPVSIKIRINSGCFHREHSPQAFALIDEHVRRADDLRGVHYQIDEHETGPEIIVILAVTAAGLGFAKSVVELITAIIKARSEGIKRGDQADDPLELIVRGYLKDGEYFEEKILRIGPKEKVSAKKVQDALAKVQGKQAKKRSKKKRD